MNWNKDFTNAEIRNLEDRYITKKERVAKEGRGLEFALSFDDWMMLGNKLLGKGVCDYSGLGFVFPGPVTGFNPHYPSIERIDSTKGYVPGNVCVVGRRANQLKDKLVDKLEAITIIEPEDRKIVQGMMLNFSGENLELLKSKYILPTETDMNTDEIMQNSNNMISISSLPVEEVDNSTEVLVEEAEAVEEEIVPPANEIPEDVSIALAYANYCNTFAGVGMKVSVSYAQFKAKYTRTTCALTGDKLEDGEPKALLIMDMEVGFAKDNFIIVSKKMETAMTNLIINTRMSLPKIAAMLSKAVG